MRNKKDTRISLSCTAFYSKGIIDNVFISDNYKTIHTLFPQAYLYRCIHTLGLIHTYYLGLGAVQSTYVHCTYLQHGR